MLHRVLSPLSQLRDEGRGTLAAHELLLVGKTKTFHTLLMEERARVRHEALTTGMSPSAFGSPDRGASPVAPPDLGSPDSASPSPPGSPRRGVDVEVQVSPATETTGAMTGLTMSMLATRDTIIEAQGETLARLRKEEERLVAILSGENMGILDYLGSMEVEWLVDNKRQRNDEDRAQAVFDAAAIVNHRQFMREQRKVDRRTRRRAQRYHVVQSRIESLQDMCVDRHIDPASPDGTPRRW